MVQAFVQNQWYTAARSDEVTSEPLARKICNEDMVLYRGQNGKAAMLQDRCSHRMAPLSRGEVVGDQLRCGYHGTCFNSAGECTDIPSQRDVVIPRGMNIRSYPVHEAHDLVFVWFGDPARADKSQIPTWFDKNTEPGWKAVHGYHHVAGHYQLIVDNILDLTHTTYLHKTTLSGPGVDETPMEVDIAGNTVRTSRIIRDVEPPPFQKAIMGFTTHVDRWQFSEFNPAIFILVTIGAKPVNIPDNFSTPLFLVLNSATPETLTTTHYFWSVARTFRTEDEALSQKFREMISFAFDEDARMIAAQQARICAAGAGEALVNFRGDTAGASARRIVRRQLEAERAAAGTN